MRQAVRFGVLTFVGLVVLQAAWIVTVPPFRGIDEFDHVFRAVGVADGQWVLTETTNGGRGLVVELPSDVVDAAQGQCAWLEYTGRDNCFPISTERSTGRVEILTAAGKYHPGYYWLIGVAGAPFHGAGVDYAMRAASGLLCALGAGVAAGCLVLAGAGRWARFGFLLGFSPMLAYTSALPAPNAIEIVAALLVWSGLLGLFGTGHSIRARRMFLSVATSGAAVLVTVRYLGPLWLVLIVLACLINAWGSGALTKTWSGLKARIVCALCVITILVAASGAWSYYSGLLAGSADQAETGGLVPDDLGLRPVLWMLQMVAAFPLRREVAPPAVYAAYLMVFLPVLILGIRYSRGRNRVAIVATTLAVLLVPAALTLATIQSHGSIWQGRYTLPLGVGVPILAGMAMDSKRFAAREGARLVLVGFGVLAVAHASALVGVLARVDNSVSRSDPSWLHPSPLVLIAMTLGAVSMWVLATQARGGSGVTSAASLSAPLLDGVDVASGDEKRVDR